MKERVLAFIPMYNCRRQIARVIGQFDRRAQSFIDEILILDNGSADGSREAAALAIQGLPIRASVRMNAENYNLGGSHKVAFNYALEHGFDYLIVLHGDDQGFLGDLIGQLEGGAHREVSCLLGARFMRGSRLVGYSLLRTAGNYAFNALASLIAGRKVRDLGSGLNLYRTEALSGRYYLKFPNSLLFNVYMLLYSIDEQLPIRFFPISWREEDQVSNVRMFSLTATLLGVLGRYLFSRPALLRASPNHEEDIEYRSNLIAGNTGAAGFPGGGAGCD